MEPTPFTKLYDRLVEADPYLYKVDDFYLYKVDDFYFVSCPP